MTIITIHEFSTGIAVQGTPENWWSTRFTGYMNLTLAKVPAVLQNAISNRLFQVAEGSVREAVETARAAGETTVQPAIIVREVKEGNNAYSAIAVITPAKDEKGRTISVYRYFLTAGLGNLTHLLYWYFKKAKRPVFDPFDIKNEGDYYEFHTHNNNGAGDPLSKQEFKDLLASSEEIITIPYNLQCAPRIIHELASRRKKNNELIAWAYKVEGLSKPWYFKAIYPASKRAEESIKKQIKQRESIPPFFEKKTSEKIATREAIKNLSNIQKKIKLLANQGMVSSDFLHDIEKALVSDIYTDQVWKEDIFEILGIQSIKDDSDSSQNRSSVRLFELYGLIIYQEFPEFLNSLKLDKISKNDDLDQEHYYIASELSRNIQEQINQSPDSFLRLELKAFQGMDYIISNLVLEEGVKGIKFTQETRKNLLKNWLTIDNDGLWQTVYQKYYRQLWKDIIQIAKNYITAKNVLIKAYAQTQSANQLSSEINIKKILEQEIPQSGSSNNRQQTMSVFQGVISSHSTHTNTNNNSHPKDSYELRYAYNNLQVLGQDNWKSITEDMVKLIWYGRYPKNPKYSYLAEFFGDRTNYYLSALFHTMDTGEVPNSIWKKCGFPAKYEIRLKFIDIPDSPIIELSRRLELWKITIRFIIKLLIKSYQFLFEPYPYTPKVLLNRYLIIFVLTIILIDGFKFSPIRIGKDAFTNSKDWVIETLSPEKLDRK